MYIIIHTTCQLKNAPRQAASAPKPPPASPDPQQLLTQFATCRPAASFGGCLPSARLPSTTASSIRLSPSGILSSSASSGSIQLGFRMLFLISKSRLPHRRHARPSEPRAQRHLRQPFPPLLGSRDQARRNLRKFQLKNQWHWAMTPVLREHSTRIYFTPDFSTPIFFRNGSMERGRPRNFSMETLMSRESPT